MSVQTQITRIQQAKNDIASAISDKGVSVPSDAKIDAMAALVRAIGANPILQEKSVTPAETAQTVTPDSGYDGLSSVSVGAISDTYVGSAVPRKEAEMFIPGTEMQTIEADQYLAGPQFVYGDPNLLPENIRKGVSLFNVDGIYEGSGGGLPNGISALASGSFTPAEDYSSSGTDITHNLGVIPNFFAWIIEDGTEASAPSTVPIATCGATIRKPSKYTPTSSIVYTVSYFLCGYNSASQFATPVASRASNATYMTATTCRMYANSTYPLKTGYTYRWVCGVIDGVN